MGIKENSNDKYELDNMEIPLVHVQQKFSWDCGVSAVMMVLSDDNRSHFQENLETIAKEEGFGESTWTIDLAYLLHRFGVSHLYSTNTLGVNPEYNKEDFYRQVLTKDEQRINEKFKHAAAVGVNVEKRSIELQDILYQLQVGNPAIVLVNANLLYCDTCHVNKLLLQLINCCHLSPSYQGHYIVLCGYDLSQRKLLYRNPSVYDRVCSMPLEAFDLARKSFGTDEDVIFVYSRS